MKIVLVKENGVVRILESEKPKKVEASALNLRSRLSGGDLKYYELDYEEREGCPLDGFVAALNQYPQLLTTSDMIKEI